ncbi:MAG: hypothetical protein OJJ54_03410 [Pseudonocardia sp.]|nr:hypothetical protein [Pseudonocardia sp.]
MSGETFGRPGAPFRARRAILVAVVLVVVLVGGGIGAAVARNRTFEGSAPLYSPPVVAGSTAGPTEVTLSLDALAHPEAEAVRGRLQSYFDAINAKDYRRWADVVVPERAVQQPEEAWQEGVRTTVDGSIRVDRIDDYPGDAVLALVRFVSTQDPADAPDALRTGRICWRGTLPLTGTPLRIDTGSAGSLVGAPC